MDVQDLLSKIDYLELESVYGEPVDAAKAAMELAKCRNQLARMYGYDNYFDFKDSGELDKITRAHQDGKPVPQGMHSGEEYNEGSVFTARVQMKYGRGHLDYCDGLRTIGYSEAEIKNMCKQEGIKYNPPSFQVGAKPKTKNPVKHNQPNPVRPNNTIKRLWN